MFPGFLTRLRALLRPAALDRDIRAEIDSHVDRETDALVAAGLPLAAARAEAHRRFGNVALDRERARDAFGWTWPAQFLQDVRYATRSLARAPMFTLAAVVSLGLAIGANATIFAAIEALLLRPLAVDRPDRLVTLEQTGKGDNRAPNLSLGDLERFRALPVFSGMTAVSWADAFNVTASAAPVTLDPKQLRVSVVTGSFFRVLGLQPAAGRLFGDADDSIEGGNPVVVISHDYWARRFSKAPTAIGSTVTILGTPYSIVGVAPASFHGDWVGWPTDLWVPVSMANQIFGTPAGLPAPRGARRQYKLIARLADGISIEAAELAARVERDRVAREAPSDSGIMKSWGFVLSSAANGYSAQRAEFRQPLVMLMGIVAALLLIACANVASLLLARGAAREAELGVRAAIGASRSRLVRQLLTESLVLAVLGGLTGIALAVGGTSSIGVIAASGPAGSVQWGTQSVQLEMAPDMAVVLFTAALCAIATLLFGLTPALRAVRSAARHALIGQLGVTRTTTGSVRLRSGLVVAQIAITLVLLCSAALFMRSIHNLRSERLGFDPANLVLAWVLPGYANGDRTSVLAHMAQIEQRIASMHGVAAVSSTGSGVFSGAAGASPRLRREGEPDSSAVFADDGRFVAPGFFHATGQRLVSGRDFRASDDVVPVLIVDESFARKMFGTADVTGRRLLVGTGAGVPQEIVGVVADAKYSAPRANSWMTVYMPLAQMRTIRRACFVVRADGNPSEIAIRLRQELATIDPDLPVLDVNTVTAQMDRVLFRERLVEQFATVFAVIALVLACLGIYGVTSFLANRRAREIGIRIALGARFGDVLRLVAARSLWLIAVGIAIGIGGALASRQVVATHLYGVSAGDPITIAGVAGVFVLAGLVAAVLPAVRSARRPPVSALRSE
jgi:predicted permease